MSKTSILSIETSAKVCSVNLNIDGKPIATYETFVEKSSSELLKTFSERILQDHQLKFEEISAIAVSEGPGSYTGLRIGVSFAKGICYAIDKPLIAVNTLQAMALQIAKYPVGKQKHLIPMLDARRMEVYTATFDLELNFLVNTNALIVDAEFVKEHAQHAVFFGDGAFKLKHFETPDQSVNIIENIFPTASTIGILAFERFNLGLFEDLAYFEPFYLKDFHFNEPKK